MFIATTIVSAAELAAGAKKVSEQSIPLAPAGLPDKNRWIQCTVKNETQFSILFQHTYFDSGRYWTVPQAIPAFEQMTFSGCSSDNGFLVGVSGGNTFSMTLDGTNSFNIALGWTSPQFGAFKTAAVESNSPEAGYNAATENGNAIVSANKYQGKDQEGNPVTIEFHISAAPSQNALYVINQVIVN